jgi:hypothetical protein
MDSVRFGRALGIGARGAAKALAGAADAATAPNPSPAKPRTTAQRAAAPDPAPSNRAASTPPPTSPIASAAQSAARATVQARKTSAGVARGSKRFGEAVWGPFVKLSGVLWLEITGSFFGLFALFAGQAAWTHRADLRTSATNHDARIRALIFLAMTLVFGYFCITSFLRARRRERRG